MIDLAFSLTLVAMTLVVAVAYAGRVSRAGAARHSRIERAGSSPLLGKSAMEMGYWAMRPAARACVALGVSANAVSLVSLGLAVLAGVALAAGAFGVGAALSLLSSAGDALDGMIARDTGTASDSGEVLDAAVDRYAELFFFGGVAYFERFDGFTLILALTATAGAIMVSYSSAKGEALHVPVPRGAMRRQERTRRAARVDRPSAARRRSRDRRDRRKRVRRPEASCRRAGGAQTGAASGTAAGRGEQAREGACRHRRRRPLKLAPLAPLRRGARSGATRSARSWRLRWTSAR
jgi:phosphatidylglycerophosphate synthase